MVGVPAVAALGAKNGRTASVRLVRSRESERVPETGAVGVGPGGGDVRRARAARRDVEARVPRAPGARLLALAQLRDAGPDPGCLRPGVAHRRPAHPPPAAASLPPPEYETETDLGCVTWPIERGVLVAREGRDGDGFLRIRAGAASRGRRPPLGDRRRPGRGPQLLPVAARIGPLCPARCLALRADPAAHPRARLQRFPALAGDGWTCRRRESARSRPRSPPAETAGADAVSTATPGRRGRDDAAQAKSSSPAPPGSSATLLAQRLIEDDFDVRCLVRDRVTEARWRSSGARSAARSGRRPHRVARDRRRARGRPTSPTSSST